MKKYAIQFDYPEVATPWFAGLVNHAFGLTSSFDVALKYDHEADAARVLENAYGPSMNEIGRVIEVEAA